MTPYKHAESDVKRWGGVPEDYIKIHLFFDQTKAYMPDERHRIILHNAFGISLCEQVFGSAIKNSNGAMVPVRSIAEIHVLTDLKHIPTFNDCFGDLPQKDWIFGKNSELRKLVFSKLENEDEKWDGKTLKELAE